MENRTFPKRPQGWTARSITFVVRLLAATVVVGAFFVLTQDFQIFPGVGISPTTPPEDVTEFTVTTSDGEKITAWRVTAAAPAQPKVALLFHGNAQSLTSFVNVQRWFAQHGFTNYAVSYRGYGKSTGFPSEEGIYRDGEAVMELLLTNERLMPNDVVVFGNSIGTGPAAYIAARFNTNSLILIAPYADLPTLVSELPFFWVLSPFLRYHFPVREYVGQLVDTCVIAAHGERDTTIPFHHATTVRAAYSGSKTFSLIAARHAGHNDILSHTHAEVMQKLRTCLGG